MLSIIGFYRREILEELFKLWALDAIKNKVENQFAWISMTLRTTVVTKYNEKGPLN